MKTDNHDWKTGNSSKKSNPDTAAPKNDFAEFLKDYPIETEIVWTWKCLPTFTEEQAKEQHYRGNSGAKMNALS